MVTDDLIVTVARIHLPRLGPHLVIFSPVLLRSHAVEVTSAFLIGSAIQIHTLVDMVIDVESINREVSPLHEVNQLRMMLFEPIDDVHCERTRGIVRDVKIDPFE